MQHSQIHRDDLDPTYPNQLCDQVIVLLNQAKKQSRNPTSENYIQGMLDSVNALKIQDINPFKKFYKLVAKIQELCCKKEVNTEPFRNLLIEQLSYIKEANLMLDPAMSDEKKLARIDDAIARLKKLSFYESQKDYEFLKKWGLRDSKLKEADFPSWIAMKKCTYDYLDHNELHKTVYEPMRKLDIADYVSLIDKNDPKYNVQGYQLEETNTTKKPLINENELPIWTAKNLAILISDYMEEFIREKPGKTRPTLEEYDQKAEQAKRTLRELFIGLSSKIKTPCSIREDFDTKLHYLRLELSGFDMSKRPQASYLLKHHCLHAPVDHKPQLSPQPSGLTIKI